MKYLVLLLFLCSCAIMQPRVPTYTYSFRVLNGNLRDGVFYSDVPYAPGDTIVEIPSKHMIVITDVKFYKDGK